MSCHPSQAHSNELCLCSACHLSSQLFPRRQDGKIVLPGLPASRDPTSLIAESRSATVQSDSEEFHLPPLAGPNELPQVSSLPQATSHVPAERGNRPHVRSNTRTAGSGTSFGQPQNVAAGTDSPSGIPEHPMGSSTSNNRVRPRSLSHSYHTATTTVSNPYPMPADGSYPRPSGKSSLDNRAKVSAPEQTMSASLPPPSTSTSVNNDSATPTLKFCPPFVSSDRIALPANSDDSKEGVTMIPWSARRRKQKYRSGFDSGTGQGKSKTMFRYYGPEGGSNYDSDIKKQ